MQKIRMSGIAAAAALATLLALPALAQNIAIVNGKPIPKSRADLLIAQVVKSGRPSTPDLEKQVKDELIRREILMQEAQKQGLDTTDDYKAQMEIARQTIIMRALLEKVSTVTDAEAKAEYDKAVAANSGKEYKAHHILVDKEADAKDIIARLKKGAKFEDIAKKQSKDTGSGANGGDLDWANPSSYVPEFTEGLVKLKKGQVTDVPVKSQFGYHVIRLDDVREAKLPAFEQVKPQIMQQLQQQKAAKYEEDLQAKAKIE
ncbi:MAG: peptidylprolyl isomerase [Pseudomonadota bacterium]